MSDRQIVWGRYCIPMDGPRRIMEDAGVLIEGGRIADVDGIGELRERHPGIPESGGSGVAVLPGLINTHTHLSCGVFRGYIDDMPLIEHDVRFMFPAQQYMSSEIVHAASRLTCLELLRAGVTTVLDAYLQPRASAQAIHESGMRGVVSPAMMDRWLGGEPAPLTRTTDQCMYELEDLRSEWDGADAGRITVWPAPFTELTASPELLRASGEYAREWGTGVQIHLAETLESVHLVKRLHGTRVLEYVEECGLLEGNTTVGAHCCWLSESDIAVIKRNAVSVSYCPSSEMKMSDGVPPAARLRAEGVPVPIAIDATCVNNSADLFREAKLGALLQKIVSPLDPELIPAEQALEMITCTPARAAGMHTDIGSLEVGKAADVITVDVTRPHYVPLLWRPRPTIVNHLIYSGSGEDVRDVWVGGRKVVSDGHLETLDEEEVIRTAQSAIERLVEDSGIDRESVDLNWGEHGNAGRVRGH